MADNIQLWDWGDGGGKKVLLVKAWSPNAQPIIGGYVPMVTVDPDCCGVEGLDCECCICTPCAFLVRIANVEDCAGGGPDGMWDCTDINSFDTQSYWIFIQNKFTYPGNLTYDTNCIWLCDELLDRGFNYNAIWCDSGTWYIQIGKTDSDLCFYTQIDPFKCWTTKKSTEYNDQVDCTGNIGKNGTAEIWTVFDWQRFHDWGDPLVYTSEAVTKNLCST